MFRSFKTHRRGLYIVYLVKQIDSKSPMHGARVKEVSST